MAEEENSGRSGSIEVNFKTMSIVKVMSFAFICVSFAFICVSGENVVVMFDHENRQKEF